MKKIAVLLFLALTTLSLTSPVLADIAYSI